MSVFKVLLGGIVAALVNTSSGVFASEFDGTVGDSGVPAIQEDMLHDQDGDERSSSAGTPVQDLPDSFNEDAVRELTGQPEGSIFIRVSFADGTFSDLIVARMEDFNRNEVSNGREVERVRIFSNGEILFGGTTPALDTLAGGTVVTAPGLAIDLTASIDGLSLREETGSIDFNQGHVSPVGEGSEQDDSNV